MNIDVSYDTDHDFFDDYGINSLHKGLEKPSSFKNSTLAFIENCKSNPDMRYDIRTTSYQLGFKQRRFYEVISVFETIGCCPKVDSETFVWIGFEQTRYTIERIANEHGVFYPNYTLEDIFCNHGCISVQRVTEEFLLLFISLERRKINILEASSFLSRDNDREKTTRCKLYQVAAILEIAKIIRKTEKPSEFELLPEYFIKASDKMKKGENDPISLLALLNRPEPFCLDMVCPAINSRIREYYSFNE